MMNHSAFDDHVKKQFGDFQPEVPAHIWENITAAKNKRRPIAWWTSILNNKKFLITLAVLLLGLSGILIYRNNHLNTTASIETGAQQSQNTESPKTNKSTQSITENTVTQNATTEIPVNPLPNNKETTQGTKPVENQTATVPTAQKNTPGQKGTSASEPRGNELTSTPGAMKNPVAGQIDKQPVQTGQDITVDNVSAGIARNRKQKKTKARMLASVTDANAETDTNTGDETSPESTGPTSNLADLNRKILEWEKIDAEKKFTRKLINKSFNLSPIPCPEKNAAGNKKYFEVYGAVDYALRKFNDTAHSQYLQKRKESTTFSSAFSGGIRYTRVFSNAMSFRAGLNYSQVNEKFRYVQDNIVQVVYIINNNGDTTGSFSSTYTRYKVTQNRYRTIDLPVTIGYEIGNERIHANINAGVVMNIYSWQKGDVLDTAYRPVSITTGKGKSPYQFKTNIGLGFTAAASIYYKLTDRLHLLGEPYIRYNLSPANKADITLKQKFTTIGLRLGIRLDF